MYAQYNDIIGEWKDVDVMQRSSLKVKAEQLKKKRIPEPEKKIARHQLTVNSKIPHIVKYMGSKSSIIDYVVDGLNECYNGGAIVDLFSGSATLSGALRGQVPIISNDIQKYSEILAGAYLSTIDWRKHEQVLDSVVEEASRHVEQMKIKFPDLEFNYHENISLEEFRVLEQEQQGLLEYDFEGCEYYLFTQNYSGTYWSFEQCLWIDAIRAEADKYKGQEIYYIILASLMFAMSYNSQSTGHYAQYRDANNEKSMKDILIYRRKEILPFFKRKYEELKSNSGENPYSYRFYSLDYAECLELMDPYSTIYADPPYAFVHYSRFYHALETLVMYDYPEVKYKGRYRLDRHQSPFSIKSQVTGAFSNLFRKTKEKKSNLVLSYSNSGMITLPEIVNLAKLTFGDKYDVETRMLDYRHSRMGRTGQKDVDVQEALILMKYNEKQ